MATTIERRQVGSLRVTVNGPNAATEYAGISAIGIGHNHKDLVLVPADGGKPIEVKPDEWDALTIEKAKSSPMTDGICGVAERALMGTLHNLTGRMCGKPKHHDSAQNATPHGDWMDWPGEQKCPSCGGPLRVHGGSASFQKGALMCDAEGCNSVWTEREVQERAL